MGYYQLKVHTPFSRIRFRNTESSSALAGPGTSYTSPHKWTCLISDGLSIGGEEILKFK
jgi:hypothetical protein